MSPLFVWLRSASSLARCNHCACPHRGASSLRGFCLQNGTHWHVRSPINTRWGRGGRRRRRPVIQMEGERDEAAASREAVLPPLPLCVTSLCISGSRSGLRLPPASLVLWFCFAPPSGSLRCLGDSRPATYFTSVSAVGVIVCVISSPCKASPTPFVALAPLQTYIYPCIFIHFFLLLLPFIKAQAQESVQTHRSRCNFKLPESA